MDRRAFIKLGTVVFALSAGCNFRKNDASARSYSITIDSNRSIGHLARKAMVSSTSMEVKTDVLVVGAGIAGLAAANSLRRREVVICELNSEAGGTSGAVQIGKHKYAQGAHYDVSYPSNFGEDGLALLERFNVIIYNKTLDRWDFVDKEHVIKSEVEERCLSKGKFIESVLPGSELKMNFLDLMRPYRGNMPLPTTHISDDFKYLDHLNFAEYLSKYLPVTSDFLESIDYQMLDDYGGGASQVSALAGIHYYRCRDYYNTPEPEVFSPTEGNNYFIQKLMNGLSTDQVKLDSLVIGLEKMKQGWGVDVWEVTQGRKVRYQCNNVIYAGQKHLLKYIYPQAYLAFQDVKYAPWIVINIELENELLPSSFWQNDFLSSNGQFLGFINSKSQTQDGNTVLTAYYCYPDVYHYMVQDIEDGAEQIVDQTIGFINTYFNLDVKAFIKHVYVKLLGHAMPVPIPGYLSKERDLNQDGLTFAGVDTGRLPLFFDALDSGISAANRF